MSSNSPKQRPIIVLGVDRSGTSLIGNLLLSWGAYGGDPEQLTKGDNNNPNGYFENRLLSNFVDDELNDGDDPEYAVLTPGYRERIKARATSSTAGEKAKLLIEEMNQAAEQWFWKQPNLCIQLPFWNELWADPIFIIAVRNPLDSVSSWQKFYAPARLRGIADFTCTGLLRWQLYLTSVLEGTRDSPSKIFVSYEDLLQSPLTECDRIFRFLDEETNRPNPTSDEKVQAIAQIISPDLCNNRSVSRFSDCEQASKEQKDLYRYLLEKTKDSSIPFAADEFPLTHGWREFLDSALLIFGAKEFRERKASPIQRLKNLTLRVFSN